jgi:hypothetical protein
LSARPESLESSERIQAVVPYLLAIQLCHKRHQLLCRNALDDLLALMDRNDGRNLWAESTMDREPFIADKRPFREGRSRMSFVNPGQSFESILHGQL